MRLGVISGSVIPSDVIFEDNDDGPSSSCIGKIECGENEILMIARHGSPSRIPPHKVDHASNLRALKEHGADNIVSICSTGSLDPGIEVPSYWVPEDYIDLFSGATIVDDSILHITPSFNEVLRSAILEGFRRTGIDVNDGGVYVQTRGPRLETKAEVRMLSSFGDIIGMNLGSECTIACEMGIPFAGIATVDNPANGIGDLELDYRDILVSAEGRWMDVKKVLLEVMDILSSN